MATATARHILVESEDECNQIKTQIDEGSSFEAMAKDHSKCPSGQRGGDLGSFSPDQMVKEFDEVVFSGEVGVLHGPVHTQFGYHLLEITSRVP